LGDAYLAQISTREAHGLDRVREFTRDVEETKVDLLVGFARLKAQVGVIKSTVQLKIDLRDLDPSQVLEPFLEVIRSGDTNGYITGTALASVETFMHFRIIGTKLNNSRSQLGLAISNLTHAVTRCKFEATDVVSDEIVLSRILKLL
jgi:hypothetical protein